MAEEGVEVHGHHERIGEVVRLLEPVEVRVARVGLALYQTFHSSTAMGMGGLGRAAATSSARESPSTMRSRSSMSSEMAR